MTAEELIKDMEACQGPCERFCIYCPEQNNLSEIYNVVKTQNEQVETLKKENIRLIRLLQKFIEKAQECSDTLKDVVDKTYIFRRGQE